MRRYSRATLIAWARPIAAAAAIAGAVPAAALTLVPSAPAAIDRVLVDAAQVPLHPENPSMSTIGDFRYAGGLVLRARQSTQLHELSDIVFTAADRFIAVGDGGVLFDARLLLDGAGRLSGVTDGNLTRLVGKDMRPLSDAHADAEGLTVLPNGDRLVSFERDARIWRYPRGATLPRDAPSPRATFEANAGMEAIAAAPDLGDDAYLVGSESTGETWTCRLSAACVQGPTVAKPKEFGLVSMTRLPDGLTAYLLRAYDPIRRSRIALEIFRGTTRVARLDLAAPLTVDNFEGVASTAGADGRRRFYLISDDNNNPTQRTLLIAFDWAPR